MRAVASGQRLAGPAGRLLPLLAVMLVAVPIFEVWLLIQVGQLIGVWPTVGLLVLEALLGGWLMRREGGRAWKALDEAFRSGRMPTGELADAALVMGGGVLLVLPGFATDVMGFCCLLPFTRPLARRLLGFLIARRMRRLGVPDLLAAARRDRSGGSRVVIEGETADRPAPSTDQPGPQVLPDPPVLTGEEDPPRPTGA